MKRTMSMAEAAFEDASDKANEVVDNATSEASGADGAASGGESMGAETSMDGSVLDEMSAKARILIGYSQITGFTDSVFTVPWPESFKSVTGTLRALNADVMAIFGGLACTLQSDFASAFVEHMLVLPTVLVLCLLAFAFAVKAKIGTKPRTDGKTCSRATMKPRVFKVISFMVFLLYPGLAVRLFTWFKCAEIDGSFYLEADHRMLCYEGEWNGWLVMVLLLIGIYVLGVPLGLLWVLRKKHKQKQLDDDDVKLMFGSLYLRYERQYYYWEVVELFKKFLPV